MKLNKISMVIAAMAFVGCSSDDFNLSSNKTVDESGMIQLDENFVIAGVGEEGAATRTHWEWDNPIAKTALVNKFLPIYDGAATFLGTLDRDVVLEAQAVGLCWLGNGAVGTDVYTNYEFYHFGWLNNGATKATFECNELKNGAMYDEIIMGGTVAAVAGDEADPRNWDAAAPGGVPNKARVGGVAGGADNLNYNSGVYKTDNKAIFGGKYIVYYPYNEDFKDAGTIPAKAETTFNAVSTSYDDATVGHATFRYSAPVAIEGGDQAADFGLYNLSTLVQLRVATPSTLDLSATYDIDKIILYSPSQQLLKQANLAADKIAAGKKGAELYASTEGTKTIVANFAAAQPLRKTDAAPGPVSAYITVLPTTVEDLVVLVHSASQSKWAKVSLPNTVFEAGKAKRLDITINSATDFQTDYIAVDEPTLTTARNEARLAAGPAAQKTITVIGDITLATSPYDLASNANDANIFIKGDDIIVPENVTLNVATNMQSNIRVLGKSCCSPALFTGGILDIQGGTVNNVTMEPTEANVTPATYDQYNPLVTFTGNATVAAGKTFDAQAGNIEVSAAVKHKGNINIAEGVTLTVVDNSAVLPAIPSGDIQFMGSTVVNNGTIEVEKNGKFDMTDADGNATATDGQRMTNNGTFIHNVDAGVGTAVQSMHQNGEYRCRVDEQTKLDDAFLQWTACSVIEMVNAGPEFYNLGTAASIAPTAYKHNGKYIDIEVNTLGALTTFDNPVVNATKGDEDIQIGNLTVVAGALDIDYVNPTLVGTVWKGYRTLTVNGDMTVNAATTITDSKKINVTGNLTVDGAGVILTYAGNKANIQGLAVTGDITVKGAAADFDASALDALNITCANFYLQAGAQAEFGNRSEGDTKNLVVSGTIANPAGCTFDILAANTGAPGSVLAWVTCSQLTVGGTFTNARPRVQ